MNRRRFIAAAAASGLLAGCTGSDNGQGTDTGGSGANASVENSEEGENETEEEEEPEPEPEGGDGNPYYHYDLEVLDTYENRYPVWVDQNGRMYGRRQERIEVSDDWWETTETLYDFADKEGKDGYVQMVLVPDNGRIIASIGGRSRPGGKVELLNRDLTGSETVYQFDYGRASNSMGHAVYGDIIVMSCYKRSDYENGNHANEVILSTDGGQSFEQILEVPVVDTDAANNHIHDVEWDPFADRIWVVVGDHGNSQLYWSDDMGDSWTELTARGGIAMMTQVAAFENSIVLGSDGAPDGITRWERENPTDEPSGADEFVRPHVQLEHEHGEKMATFARRRWHIRENVEGPGETRELCLMPFGFSPMADYATESFLLASVDGDEWYQLHRTDTRDTLLTNVMGPLSFDGELRTLVSDSNQDEGYQIDGIVPEFWD